MKKYNVDLKKVLSHGRIKTDFIGDFLYIMTQTQNNRFYSHEMPLNSFVQIPQKYRLPLRIDIRAKIDVPSMFLILGKGHVTFGTSFLDNRRIGDIIEPNPKIVTAFDNNIKIDTFYDFSVIYDLKYMQILINDEEKYYSKSEKYMKSPLLETQNSEGLELKIAGSKQSNLIIATIAITEFDRDELINFRLKPNNSDRRGICLSIDRKVKTNYEECISKLSDEIKVEIMNIDNFLLSNKVLKVKRKIEGTSQACKINYVSTHGFSYALHVSETIVDHFFWWYMVSNYTYENKYMGQKNDMTNVTLKKVSEIYPDIADHLASYFDECSGCSKNCLVKKVYEYDGKKILACHGKMIMNMNVSTFKNMNLMFKVLSELING